MNERLSFHAGFQFAWDSTSLGVLKECPRKYYYTIVLGWRPRIESVHLTFGILVHRGIEFYHRHKAKGASHEQAVLDTIRFLMLETWDFERQRPWVSDDSNKNRFTLVRSVVWYLDKFEDDPLKLFHFPDGTPAVELSFRYELGMTLGGQSILMCGHMDRIVEFNSYFYVADSKTTKNTLTPDFFKKFNPDNQMTNYTIGGKVALHVPVKGVIIDGMQIAVGFARFLRGETERTEDQLNEWLDDTKWWISTAYRYADFEQIKIANGQNPMYAWPMNDKSCHNYGGCAFRDICGKGMATREKWLAASFHSVLWDPLKVRGDI